MILSYSTTTYIYVIHDHSIQVTLYFAVYQNGTLKHHFTPAALPGPYQLPVHVCYSADENAIVGLVSSIRSVQMHTKKPLHFHILIEQHILNDLR